LIMNNLNFYKYILFLLVFCFIIFGNNIAQSKSNGGDAQYSKKVEQLMWERDYVNALRVVNIGLMKYPRSGALYYQRAVIYQGHFKRYAEAINDYYMKLKIDRKHRLDHAKIYYRIAVCKYKLDMITESIGDFNTAIKLTPRYSKAYISRAKAYAKLGRTDLAMADLQTCMKMSPKMSGAVKRLMMKIAKGEQDF